jgi:hypothetical protein
MPVCDLRHALLYTHMHLPGLEVVMKLSDLSHAIISFRYDMNHHIKLKVIFRR